MSPKLLATDFDRVSGAARYVYQIEVSHSEMVPTADGKGVVSQPLPPTLEEVIIEANMAAIARSLGTAAVRNKGGKSSDGFVTVTHKRPKTPRRASNE